MKKTIFYFGLFAFLLSSCQSGNKTDSESNNNKYSAIITKHSARINDIRNFLSSLKNSLPETDSKIVSVDNINPALNLGGYNDTTGNTIILEYNLLSAPENPTSDSLFGLYYDTRAINAFKWTGEKTKNQMCESGYMSENEVDKILSSLSVEKFTYLLIVKPTNFEKLKLNNDNSFEGGSATASCYLYDLKNKNLLSSISITAAPDMAMSYAYNTQNDAYAEAGAANKKIKETMEKNMQNKVFEWLKAITNNSAIVPASRELF